MNRKNKLLENKNIAKNILERLEDPYRVICLYDCKDNTKIIIDDDLLNIINRYYQDKYMEG